MDESTTSVGAPVDRPLFVVGYPRSGTTMLRLMLHSHPRIAIPYETSFLLAAYRHRRRFVLRQEPDESTVAQRLGDLIGEDARDACACNGRGDGGIGGIHAESGPDGNELRTLRAVEGP